MGTFLFQETLLPYSKAGLTVVNYENYQICIRKEICFFVFHPAPTA